MTVAAFDNSVFSSSPSTWGTSSSSSSSINDAAIVDYSRTYDVTSTFSSVEHNITKAAIFVENLLPSFRTLDYFSGAEYAITPVAVFSLPETPRPGSGAAAGCASFRLYFNTVVIGLLCLVGLIGNGVSVAVLRRDRHNRVAVFLLKALSVADSATLAVSLLVLAVFYGLLPDTDPTALLATRPYFVRFVNPLGYMAQSATVWMTVLLGVNRFLAICYPFRASRMLGLAGARIQVACVAIMSIALNVPRIFQYDIVYDEINGTSAANITTDWSTTSIDNETQLSFDAAAAVSAGPTAAAAAATRQDASQARRYPSFRLSALGDHVIFEVIYSNALYTCLVLILPLLLLVGVNAKLIVELQGMRKRARRSSLPLHQRRLLSMTAPPSRRDSKSSVYSLAGSGGGGSSSASSENSMTMVMVAIILILVVCHTPDRVVQILKFVAVDHSWSRCPNVVFFASNVSNLLIVLNSSINFVVYYVFRPRFRRILREKLCRLRTWRRRLSGAGSLGSSGGFGDQQPYSRRASRNVDDAITLARWGSVADDRRLPDDLADRLLLVRNPQSNGRRAVFIDRPVAA